MIEIRKYQKSDCTDIIKMFYDTVHLINAKDYTQEQLNVWAPSIIDTELWHESLMKNFSIVAIKNETIVGFGDIDNNAYLNRLYVHKDYQHHGIATLICEELEKQFLGYKITTYASITAKPFFEKRGYTLLKEQEVERNYVKLKNYVMEKNKRALKNNL